jgi:antitoxin PrlF
VSAKSILTSRGQVTVPKSIRESLGIKSGYRMTFTLMFDRTVLLRVKNKSLMSFAGRLRKKGRKPRPLEVLSRWLQG